MQISICSYFSLFYSVSSCVIFCKSDLSLKNSCCTEGLVWVGRSSSAIVYLGSGDKSFLTRVYSWETDLRLYRDLKGYIFSNVWGNYKITKSGYSVKYNGLPFGLLFSDII